MDFQVANDLGLQFRTVEKQIKPIKKEFLEETDNGQKLSKIRSCPYCEKKLKKSRINLHINIVHDPVCPKCPTVQKLYTQVRITLLGTYLF